MFEEAGLPLDESIAKLQHRDVHEGRFLKIKAKPVPPNWKEVKAKKQFKYEMKQTLNSNKGF